MKHLRKPMRAALLQRLLLTIFAGSAWFPGTAPAQSYTPPANPRADLVLDPGWRFIRQDVPGAQTNGFDDSAWTAVNLPHTWNNLDGEDGGNNYYRGIGWYRLHYTPDIGYTNRHLFLRFDGAFYRTDVYVNGTFLGEHQGGFGAFVFDVTTNLNIGADNVIAVQVNNALNTNIPPLSADFTFFGGLYRDVHLLVTDPLQISPMDYGSPGVYLRPTAVTSNSANLQITTVVSNAFPAAVNVTVRAVVTDSATNVLTIVTNLATLPAGAVSNLVGSTVITNEHLWDGRSDPYLYQTFVELYKGTNLADLVVQPLGFRYFRIDPTNGFFLNGRPYDLHGVDMHQDWLDCGWALTNAQRATNFLFLRDLGVTAMRLSHYEHHDYTYQLADQSGIILWSEIPLINATTETTNFYNNAKQQLRELIRQRYNHPSVICWGMYNELALGVNTGPTNLVNQLVQLETQEDPTRPSTAAVLASSNGDANSWYPQLVAFNEYFGWYESPLNGIAAWADAIHAAHPTNCIGISEYGAGASPYQHQENPLTQPTASGGLFHPEEWQNLVHETNWALMKARPFLWCKFIWNMFDFASDGRNEGDTPGRNDKGMTTYDRLVHKDVYYFYKANWTTNAMVYITGHTFTNRLTNLVTAKVYANCDSVELLVNGTSQGSQTSTNCIFTWPVSLLGGSNSVEAVGTKGAIQVTDSLSWFTALPAPVISVITPAGGAAWLASTNSSLVASVTVSNPATGSQLSTAWVPTGPGLVTLSSSNGLTTTAHFATPGIYNLNFTAYNGATANANVLAVVQADAAITNGLAAWWKMNEAGGAVAADSSGTGHNATIVNGIFTNGYLGNALLLTNAVSRGTYATQQSNQVTVAAWVRCDATGGGSFPRIVDTPSYRFFFRFSSSDVNSVGFASYDSVNGDFDSGAGTISLGAWYHVAASYDRSTLPNRPTFYVNGRKQGTTILTPPAGTPPPFSGSAYIGNSAANNRNWAGLLDDVRVYDRILSDAEIQVLAAVPPTNQAPNVVAGTNQTVVWPAAAQLSGSASDDGKPNPPGLLALSWSLVSGPGTATFANTNVASTTVSVSIPGNYVLELAADDGQARTAAAVAVAVVVRPAVRAALSGDLLQLSWDTSVLGWHLQVQTNSLEQGLGTNWEDLPASTSTNQMTITVPGSGPAIFYRLVSPW